MNEDKINYDIGFFYILNSIFTILFGVTTGFVLNLTPTLKTTLISGSILLINALGIIISNKAFFYLLSRDYEKKPILELDSKAIKKNLTTTK